MNRLGRVIVALALLCVAAVSVVAVSNSPAAGKSAEVVTPQYVKGYWPGEDPALCILDHTDDTFPIEESVAEFDQVANVSVHSETSIEGCADGDATIQIIDSDGLGPCEVGPNGCWIRGDASFTDPAGLWVHSYGGYISLNSDRELSSDRWQVVIVHEIGHALGLSHTARHDSVMRRGPNGAADNGVDGLTATDVAVINSIYPSASATATS